MDEPQPQPPPRRRWRIVGVAIGVIGALVVGAAAFAVFRAEAWVKAQATATLGAPVDFAIDALRADRVALRDVTLGPTDAPWARVAAATARFQASRLDEARLDAVKITGLVIDLDALPSTDAAAAPDDDVLAVLDRVLPFDPPVDSVLVEDAEIRLGDRRLDLEAVSLTRAAPNRWRVDAAGAADAPDGAAALSATMDVDGVAAALDLTASAIALAAAPDAAPAAATVGLRRDGDGPVAVTARLDPSPGVAIDLDGALARDGTWRAAGRLDAASPSPAQGGAALALSGDFASAALTIDVAPDFAIGPLRVDAGAVIAADGSSDGATLSVRAPRLVQDDWRVDGAEIAAVLSIDAGSWRLGLDAAVAAAEQGAQRWLGRPVDLRATVVPRGDGVAVDLKAGDRRGLVPLAFTGAGSPVDFFGDLRVGPIDLGAPGATGALRRLAPALPPDLTLDRGRVAFDGRVGLRDGAPRGDGRLSLDRLAASFDLLSLRGLSGVVDFDSLVPPRAPRPTRLTIDALDAGLALRDGVVDFTIVDNDGAPELRIGGARWSAAGGVVRSGGFAIGPNAGARRILLDIEDVAIEALLLAADIPNLDGAGRLSGRMPIIIDPDGGVRIENARLTSADGRIAYAPPGLAESLGGADPRTPQGYLLALEDFRYDQMLARADGGLDDGLTFGFTLAGRNPAVADGAPIQLEIKVEGLKPLPLLRGFSAAREAAEAAAKAASGSRR